MKTFHRGITVIELLIIISIVVILVAIVLGPVSCTIFPFGPQRTVSATVLTKHVDHKGDFSFYIVTTDQGTFEVENSWSCGVYNADEIYGRLMEKETYTLVIKGEKRVDFFFQEYPRIIEVK